MMTIEMRTKSRANAKGEMRETASFIITDASYTDMKELSLFFLRMYDGLQELSSKGTMAITE